jgi:hypothetical protein
LLDQDQTTSQKYLTLKNVLFTEQICLILSKSPTEVIILRNYVEVFLHKTSHLLMHCMLSCRLRWVCLGYGVQQHFQQHFSYIVAVCFIAKGKRSTRKKNKYLPQVTYKLYHKMLYRVTSCQEGFELTTLLVIDTDCIDSSKS